LVRPELLARSMEYTPPYQRLYINIDHVATVRQARGGTAPDPVAAALICELAGADGITAHLREDRRHIIDDDVERLATTVRTVLNLEMACTDEMLEIAERIRPHQVTLVPERRAEITTEGGLDLSGDLARIREGITRLTTSGVRTSLFIDADLRAVEQSRAVGADAVELHTGPYSHAGLDGAPLERLQDAARRGAEIGLAVHAGHGLTVENVAAVASIPPIEELNIGHSVVSRSIFIGLAEAVGELRAEMIRARAHLAAASRPA
jgi:pyridoxine 5-phosphate synthase